MLARIKTFIKNIHFMRDMVLPRLAFRRYAKRLREVILPNLVHQVVFRGTPPLVEGKGIKVLIVWIESEHYSLYSMLLVAKALMLRGAEVEVLLCDGTLEGCENRGMFNFKGDICGPCKLTQREVFPLFGVKTSFLREYVEPEKLRDINERAIAVATAYPSSFVYEGLDLIPIVNGSVTRFYYGGEASDSRELAELRRRHLSTAMICRSAAIESERRFKPDVVAGQTWVYSMGAPFYDFFKFKNKNRVVTLGMGGYNYRAFTLNYIDTFYSLDGFHKYLDMKKGQGLTPGERKELDDFFGARFAGVSDYHRNHGGFDEHADLERRLGLDRSKKNIFLFPTLYWDAAYDMIDTSKFLYPSVVEWVLGTVDLIKDDPNIVLYIKQHVRERWGTSTVKGVWDFVLEKYPVFPANVKLIPAEWKINTYSIFPLIDLGLVYSSTVGLEMLHKDVPLVVAGPAEYTGLGFAIEPKDRAHYQKALVAPRNESQLDRAKFDLFCHYFFIKRLIPFKFTERVWDNVSFERYLMESLDDILPEKDRMLDHLCDCILYDKNPCDY